MVCVHPGLVGAGVPGDTWLRTGPGPPLGRHCWVHSLPRGAARIPGLGPESRPARRQVPSTSSAAPPQLCLRGSQTRQAHRGLGCLPGKWPEQPLAALLGLWRAGRLAHLPGFGSQATTSPLGRSLLAASPREGSLPDAGLQTLPRRALVLPESGSSVGMSSRQPGRCGSQAHADPGMGEPGACPLLLPPLTRPTRLWGWRPALPSGPQPGWGLRHIEGPRRPLSRASTAPRWCLPRSADV